MENRAGAYLGWFLPLTLYSVSRWVDDGTKLPLLPDQPARVRAALALMAVTSMLAFLWQQGQSLQFSPATMTEDQCGTLIAAYGLLLGAMAPRDTRERWPFNMVWTAVRLSISFLSVCARDGSGSGHAWSGNLTLGLPFSGHNGQRLVSFWTHFVPLLTLSLDASEMTAHCLVPMYVVFTEIIFGLAASCMMVWILYHGGIPIQLLPCVSLLPLTRYLGITVVLSVLIQANCVTRRLTYQLVGIAAPDSTLWGFTKCGTIPSVPGALTYWAFLAVQRLAPVVESHSQVQVDPQGGFSTLVDLGPANQPRSHDTSDRSEPISPIALELGVTSHAVVQPVLLGRHRERGLPEVRNLVVVSASQPEPRREEEESSYWTSAVVIFKLIWQLYLALRLQIGRCYMALTWLVVARRRAPLPPIPPLPHIHPSRLTSKAEQLLNGLARVQEDDAWSSLPSPPPLATLERGLRLFWHGRLGETAYQLRDAEERRLRIEHKQELLEALRLLQGQNEERPREQSGSNDSFSMGQETIPAAALGTKKQPEIDNGGVHLCIVCFSSPRTIVLWPCRCVNMCEACRISMVLSTDTSQKALCPTCRAPVRGFSRLFFP